MEMAFSRLLPDMVVAGGDEEATTCTNAPRQCMLTWPLVVSMRYVFFINTLFPSRLCFGESQVQSNLVAVTCQPFIAVLGSVLFPATFVGNDALHRGEACSHGFSTHPHGLFASEV